MSVEANTILAAGVFMGEGHIDICPRKGYLSFWVRANVEMADVEVVDIFHRLWPGTSSRRHRVSSCNLIKKPDNPRVLYTWSVSAQKALKFFEDVLPYLRGEKKPQVELAINFQRRRRFVSRYVPRTAEEVAWDKWAHEEMKLLKRLNAKKIS